MRFIGDIHGNLKQYYSRIDCSESIQVGDFGIGFVPNLIENFSLQLNGNHRFIRGNHDNPNICKNYHGYIPDGTIETINNTTLMYIGGASSIDKKWRIEGVTWWKNEELSYKEFDKMIDLYSTNKPSIMVTHECPEMLVHTIKPYAKSEHSITRNAFNQMYEIHQPDIWIFGHWHLSYNNKIQNTNFICLDEFETINITI